MVETIAIIPARSGSERVPNKNIRPLAGHPLLAYSIQAAHDSGVCDRVIVSTNSAEIAEIAISYGAEVPGLRPEELSGAGAHDIGFLRHAMEHWVLGDDDQLWVLLRPTSPFRSGASIQQAWTSLLENPWADSIRALKKVSEHPGKMWRVSEDGEARTYLDQGGAYNGPNQDLEPLFLQASSLEIVRRGPTLLHNSIAGSRVLAFHLPQEESVDVNTEMDWLVVNQILQHSPHLLAELRKN